MSGKYLRTGGSSPTSSGTPVPVEDRTKTTVVDSAGRAYRPVQELGEGGTARAILAYSMGSGGFSKLVVLKMLHRQLADDPAAREMFEAEARLSARLNHPNLVQVYEVVDAEIPFLVMEYLDGKPLSRVMSGGAISQAMRLSIVSEALIGLHHAHELCDFDGVPLNIVHRDISPHNIFVTYDGAVKVLDFGLAKAAGAASRTETGEVKGKLAYMAPEQLLGQPVDRRADIFAAGCIIWEAAAGRRIWGEMSDGAVMHRLATGQIPRPDGRTGMDARLEEIVVKATSTAPEDRYSTALELQRELSDYIAQRWEPVSMRDAGASLALTFREERERNRKLLGSAISESLVISESGARAKATPEPEEVEVEVPPPPAPRRRWPWIAAVLLFLLLGGAGVGYFGPRRQVEAEGATHDAPPIPANPVAPQPARVHVSVRATPPGTTVEIDGNDRGPAPVTLDFPADAVDHVLRASAPGYRPDARSLKFTRDLDLDIALEKLEPKPEPDRTTTLTPAQPRYPAPPPHAVPGPKPKSSGSEENPCSPPYYFSGGIKTFKPECL